MSIDKRFFVNLQGKDFVTYEGLLDTAHQQGLTGISTEVIELPSSSNNGRCVMMATATTDTGRYTGIGDADSNNVNKMISKHIIRMAETRAKARALRDLTNIGMTAVEELGGDEGNDKKPQQKQSPNYASEAQLKKLYTVSQQLGYTPESMGVVLRTKYNVESSKQLTKEQASELIEYLEAGNEQADTG